MTTSLPPVPLLDDEQLAARFLRGDRDAFAAIYGRYNGRVTTYALRVLGRREDAEEVCTEVFVRLVERRWRPIGTVRSYLFTVAHRLCVDRLRSRRRRSRILGWFGASLAPAGEEPEGDDHRRLHAAIDQLPDEHRAAVLLTYTEGLRSAEVGQILGCTDQQVRSKLAYARRVLREHLGGDDV